MRTCIRLPNRQSEPLPPDLADEELRFPAELVRVFLDKHTRPGDVVLDPFAGYGTVLAVAEEMGRRAHGLELDAGRFNYARSRLRDPEALVHGDARRLASYGFPRVDFCMTGIPFCTWDEVADPLTWYASPGGGYAAYLADLRTIFGVVGRLTRPGGTVVIEVANLRGRAVEGSSQSPITPLAWDVARTVGEVLRFEGEVVVEWEPTYGHGYDHSYCLVFRALGEGAVAGEGREERIRVGREAVVVVPYDAAWPALFRAQAADLRAALGDVAVRIDHIGSTAVPGLAAKPVIDVQISVAELEPL